MDLELYNEMFDTKEKIDKYLNAKERDFNKLAIKLSSIGSIVSVDSIDILSNLSELQSEMESLHAEYMNAKKYSDLMKKIIINLQVGAESQKSVEAYKLTKAQLEQMGVLKRDSLEDISTLTLK